MFSGILNISKPVAGVPVISVKLLIRGIKSPLSVDDKSSRALA